MFTSSVRGAPGVLSAPGGSCRRAPALAYTPLRRAARVLPVALLAPDACTVQQAAAAVVHAAMAVPNTAAAAGVLYGWPPLWVSPAVAERLAPFVGVFSACLTFELLVKPCLGLTDANTAAAMDAQLKTISRLHDEAVVAHAEIHRMREEARDMLEAMKKEINAARDRRSPEKKD